MPRHTRVPFVLAALVLAALVALGAAAAGGAKQASPAASAATKQATSIDWKRCKSKDARDNGFECATVVVPKDYESPNKGNLRLAVTRRPATNQAHRIGPLFINYGGPGGDAVATTQSIGTELFAPYTHRFDLVAVDPRGVGESKPSIDCKTNQRKKGIYSIPFTTPENVNKKAFDHKVTSYTKRCAKLNKGVLPYVSTENVARDMDYIRGLMGDKKLNYFGFSYGTFLGATYESLFPSHVRTAVLDGALDAKGYINDPMADLREQTSGFERELGRYFQACAHNLDVCTWVQNGDPEGTYDDLIASADKNPLPVADPSVTDGDTTPVTGDDINNGTIGELYAKQLWGELTDSLNQASSGDGTFFRYLSNYSLGTNPNGPDDPGLDRYFTIGAAEQKYDGGLRKYLDAGASSYRSFDHFWSNSGYVEYNYAKYPVQGRDVFAGPFSVPKQDSTPLVVATTYDPATVYRQGKQLAADLGNARLLTMKGDGHTAYGGNSPCIDDAVDAYVIHDKLPAKGTTCDQDVPFPDAGPGNPKVARAANGPLTLEQAKLKALEQARP